MKHQNVGCPEALVGFENFEYTFGTHARLSMQALSRLASDMVGQISLNHFELS